MKKVRKFAPVYPQNISGCQAWLEDLAQQGLFLLRCHIFWYTFAREEPAQVRYRLEPAKYGTAYADQETQDSYRLLGWEYVCTALGIFHVWRCNDPGIPELYDDPQIQGEAIRRLQRALRRAHLAVSSIYVLFFLFYCLLIGRIYGTGIYIPPIGVLAVLSLALAVGGLVSAFPDIRLHRMARRLRMGLPQSNRGPYRLSRLYSGAGLVLFCALALPHIAGSAASFLEVPQTMWPLEQLETTPPYVALEVLDPSAEQVRSQARPLSAPWTEGWQTVETQRVQRPEGAEAPDAASCDTRYYCLRLDFLAKPLVWYLTRGVRTASLDLSGADEGLYGVNQDGRQVLVLRQGNQVLAVNYTGSGSLEDHLAEYTALLAA